MIVILILGVILVFGTIGVLVFWYDEMMGLRQKVWPDGNILLCAIAFMIGMIAGVVRRLIRKDDNR